jgi:DNA-binding response OmpR family regulator
VKTSILVAESDAALAGTLVEILSSGEYDVKAVSSPEVAMTETEKEVPDVMLISDQLSKGRGMELCRMVSETWERDEGPAIVFLASDARRQEVTDPSVRVDAWLRRPVDPILLKSAIESILHRRKKTIPSNPLTRLPDAVALSDEIDRRKASGQRFATCVFRMNAAHVEAYRMKYGELKFTGMIRLAARTIAGCALAHGGTEAFVAHRGTQEEPEFVVIIDETSAAELKRVACEEFDTNAEFLYDKVDRAEGGLVVTDEAGRKTTTPFVSMSSKTGIVKETQSARA